MPGFYHKPENSGELVDFVVGKILDVLGIDNQLFKRWTGENGMIKRPRLYKKSRSTRPNQGRSKMHFNVQISVVSKLYVVVDIGCGTGGLTVEFAKRAKTVYSIDINPMAIKTTIENIQKHDVEKNVEIIEANGLYVLDELGNFDIS